MIEETDLARLLKLYPILHELPPMLQHSLIEAGYSVRLKEDEVVFGPDQPVQFFFFLTSGSIRVLRLGYEREILLYRLLPGEACILSICNLLAGMPYQARASTDQPVTGVAIPEALFNQFVETSPLFCSFLFRSFSNRLEDLLALLEAVSFNRLNRRLAVLLLSKGDNVQTTHSQLADELGSVREVISRILKDFERKGWVKLERGQIKILDRRALEKVATYFGEISP